METNYDSTKDTLLHIKRVAQLLTEAAAELIRRANVHDASKLNCPEKEYFDEFTPKLAGSTYGSEEYKDFLKQMKVGLDHHYAHNTHHPEFAMMQEQWKEIEGYDAIYEVSTYGQIRSVARTVERKLQGNFEKNAQERKLNLTPKGYLRVQLAKNGNQKNLMVHRIVAETFIPNPYNKPYVNHKDGIKHNNNINNLEWCTSSENQIHAYEKGLKKPTSKYVVKCIELDIITEGCIKMERALLKMGYEKASAAAIWNCINENHNTHLDLTFEGYLIDEIGEFSYVNRMDLFDIIEMFFDWKAATERHNDGNIFKSIQINKERFQYSDQLAEIFTNTATRLGYK